MRGVKAMYKQRANKNPDVSFHYTDEDLAVDCLKLVDYSEEDIVLDVGRGDNWVWFNNIKSKNKDWVEIEDGKDFFEYNKKVDWCVGNPPYKLLWKMIEKSCDISNKGFGFLIAINGMNMMTPKRLEWLKQRGFFLSKIMVVTCKRWYGRYFFVIFSRNNGGFLTWSKKNYK